MLFIGNKEEEKKLRVLAASWPLHSEPETGAHKFLSENNQLLSPDKRRRRNWHMFLCILYPIQPKRNYHIDVIRSQSNTQSHLLFPL